MGTWYFAISLAISAWACGFMVFSPPRVPLDLRDIACVALVSLVVGLFWLPLAVLLLIASFRYWWKNWCILLLAIGCSQADAQPPQSGPLGQRPSAAEIELGRKLFFDPILSEDLTVSCSSCHHPRTGWSDGREIAVGIRGQRGTRNSPTVINSSYTPLVFWDGRTVSNVPQALLPLSNPVEMGNQSEADVLTKLRLTPAYVSLFAETFGSIDAGSLSPITGPRLARAIAAFESTIVSFNAPIDRRLDGDLSALTPDAEIGFQLFVQADCMSCHVPPLFTDNLFHNQGSEFAGKRRVTDAGRFGVLPRELRVQTSETVRAFKTPTLREIARTAPYMHAGQYPDLKRVVVHYNQGGDRFDHVRDRFIDRRIRKLRLTSTQEDYLILFLREAFASPTYPMIEEPDL